MSLRSGVGVLRIVGLLSSKRCPELRPLILVVVGVKVAIWLVGLVIAALGYWRVEAIFVYY